MRFEEAKSKYALQEGTVVLSHDGEKLGTIISCGDEGFVVEKGFFFPKDYFIPYDSIAHFGADGLVVTRRAGELRQVFETEDEDVSFAADDAGTLVGHEEAKLRGRDTKRFGDTTEESGTAVPADRFDADPFGQRVGDGPPVDETTLGRNAGEMDLGVDLPRKDRDVA